MAEKKTTERSFWPTESGERPPVWIAAVLVLPPLFWACNFVLARMLVGDVPPVALAFWRWTMASFLMLPFGLLPLWSQRYVVLRNWRWMLAFAFLGVSVFNVSAYIGLQFTTVANAALVNTSQSVLIVLLSAFLLRERLKLVQWLGVVLAVAGVVTISVQGSLATLLAIQLNIGDVIIFFAGFSWALYTVLLRRHPPGLTLPAFLMVILPLGTLFLVPVYLIELSLGYRMVVTGESVAAIFFVAIFPSILAYFFWAAATAAVAPTTAGMFYYLLPVFAIIIGWIVLGEPLEWFHLLGASVIGTGVWLTAIRPALQARRSAASG